MTKYLHPLIQESQLDLPAVNEQLVEHVRQEIEKAGLGAHTRHSNIGGWHSERNLDAKLGDGSPLSAQLIQVFSGFSAPITEYINHVGPAKFNVQEGNYDWNYAGAWFNVAFNGSYNAPHTHPGCQISGAYYIRTEEPSKDAPMSGRIDFIVDNVQYSSFPKAGTLFLFPSEMLHWVHPYHGSDIRICLSFNAKNIRNT